MQIRVIRDDGDRQGPNITDDLLTVESVGLEKGRWAINDSTSKKIENGNGPLSPSLDTGAHTQVTTKRGSVAGKLVYFTQTIDIASDGSGYFPTSSFRVETVL